jgi:hypothetical protein
MLETLGLVGLGIFGVFFFALLAVAVFALVVALLQWLWNITIPELFGVNQIKFWQAFRLILIAWILFGGPAGAGNS